MQNRNKTGYWKYGLAFLLGVLAGAPFLRFQVDGTFTQEGTQGPFHLGGVQLNEGSIDHWVETLVHQGFNTAVVTCHARQAEWF
ncbi:MAG: hypothetical protein KDC44_19335, partial [Phaeodactylibacter sp.]|nr:hypothetical protein [Phaeodactylibacter sp.]